MLSYDEAIAKVLETLRPLPSITLPLDEALGCVLAEPVCACLNLPPADNSAMDGYAFAWADQKKGATLKVAGFVPAGHLHNEAVETGCAIKIMTGAILPPGCDTVIPVEEISEESESIRIEKAPEKGQHVRYKGEEIRQGDLMLSAGTVLRSGAIGLLAAAGIAEVPTVRRPKVAVLSTGDELVELGTEPGPGQIVNSNYYLLTARLREEGFEVLPMQTARDDEGHLAQMIRQGLEADMLISTGGVSVGDRDLMQQTLKEEGFELKFWKVAIKPGKPVLFGTVGDKPVFGLPGNPGASAATFEIFARPALRRLAGFPDPQPPRLEVTLGADVRGGQKRQLFMWGCLTEEEGRYTFHPSKRQGSGQNRSIQGACALLPVAIGGEDLKAGSAAEVLLLSMPPGR